MKKTIVLFTAIFLSSYLNAQERNWDSLFKEAAKTEIYKPVPRVVTPEALLKMVPLMQSFYLTAKTLTPGMVTTVQNQQVGMLKMVL
jgi:hypothetical protein